MSLQDYQNKYPKIAACLPYAQEYVESLRQHPYAELEARFGRYDEKGNFVPGVNRNIMDSIIECMQKSSFAKGDDEWKEELDTYFMEKNVHLRTRVNYDSNAMTINSCTTEKQIILPSTTFKSSCDDKLVRISLKSERFYTNPPTSVTPYLVRIKQRRRFLIGDGTWAFDFSMTWSGKNRSEAEKSQMNEEPLFEIECELLKSDKELRLKSDTYIATSLILKMFDFLNPEGILTKV